MATSSSTEATSAPPAATTGDKIPTINAQRAYFELNGLTAGEVSQARMTFDGDETLGVLSTTNLTDYTNSADAWYSLDGVKNVGKPNVKGLYIHGGKKVVIK